jgi:hypothetical protein
MIGEAGAILAARERVNGAQSWCNRTRANIQALYYIDTPHYIYTVVVIWKLATLRWLYHPFAYEFRDLAG